jgi:flagellar biosynthesis chaperone FliJ
MMQALARVAGLERDEARTRSQVMAAELQRLQDSAQQLQREMDGTRQALTQAVRAGELIDIGRCGAIQQYLGHQQHTLRDVERQTKVAGERDERARRELAYAQGRLKALEKAQAKQRQQIDRELSQQAQREDDRRAAELGNALPHRVASMMNFSRTVKPRGNHGN